MPTTRLAVGVAGALLTLQLGLMAWLAPRGLDLTDESYALLSLVHWRELPATPTLFAWFVGPVFAALDFSVAGIRWLSALAIAGCAGWACWRLLRLYARWVGVERPELAGFVVAGMAAGLLHYSFSATLRVPAYNQLVLVAMLAATALLCDVLDPAIGLRTRLVAALGWGVAVAVAGLAKPTSGLALLLLHGLLVPALWPGLRATQAAVVAAALATGVALVFACIHAVSPNWWRVLLDGAELARMTDGRSLGRVLDGLLGDAARALDRIGPAGLALTLGLAAGLIQLAAMRRAAIAPIVVSLLATAVIGSLLRGYGKAWWALHASALVVCASILWRNDGSSLRARELRAALSLGALLMALPAAFSLGTNGSLPAHTQMASTFAVIALLLVLWRLGAAGLVGSGGIVVGLAVVAGAGLLVQWPALHDAAATYRLGTGLIEQTRPLVVGPGHATILVDPAMQNEAERMRSTARAAGMVAGDTLIDLTGDGPGWLFLLDARPPGAAWLIGGYPGSRPAALASLRRLPPTTLRRSWVLSSDDNPRVIDHSPRWLLGIDPTLRYREVVMVPVQRRYSPRGTPDPTPASLRLWRPIEDREP
jgi:hypothetical protein